MLEKKKMKPANSDTSASWINVLPSCEQAVEGTSSFTPYLGSSDLHLWDIWLRTERLTGPQILERRRKSSDSLYHNSSLNVYSVWQFRKFFDVCNFNFLKSRIWAAKEPWVSFNPKFLNWVPCCHCGCDNSWFGVGRSPADCGMFHRISALYIPNPLHATPTNVSWEAKPLPVENYWSRLLWSHKQIIHLHMCAC